MIRSCVNNPNIFDPGIRIEVLFQRVKVCRYDLQIVVLID